MPQNITLYILYQSIDFKEDKPVISALEAAFTHISYYEEKGNTKEVGNSRLVFLGMYAFKGRLSSIIGKYIVGNGKQLQHYLGNVFTNENLAKLYDNFKFEKLVNAASTFDIVKHKHIFTLAYLGFLENYATTAFIEKQALNLFLNDIKIDSQPKQRNIIQLLKAKAEAVLNTKIKVMHESIGTGINTTFITKIMLNNSEIIGQHTSKSKLYSKNKALKLALKYVLNQEKSLPNIVKFNENEQLQLEKARVYTKLTKQTEHENRQADKKEKRLKIIAEKKKLAKEKEIQRSLNKANAKKSREFTNKKEKSSKLEADITELSVKKRQRIIDKEK